MALYHISVQIKYMLVFEFRMPITSTNGSSEYLESLFSLIEIEMCWNRI